MVIGPLPAQHPCSIRAAVVPWEGAEHTSGSGNTNRSILSCAVTACQDIELRLLINETRVAMTKDLLSGQFKLKWGSIHRGLAI